MSNQRATIRDGQRTLQKLPGWVSFARAQTPEDTAFLSGAALAHLQFALTRDDVPRSLLRGRLALRAAEACVEFSGRAERAGELRDALLFLRAGDLPGPAGEIYVAWQRAIERPLSGKTLARALPDLDATLIERVLETSPRAPVVRAATVLETVLDAAPRSGVAALILADAALAQAVGHDHLVPLLAVALKRTDLRKRGDDLRLACHRAVIGSSTEALRLAKDLARRAARLNAVAPNLRAKGAAAAVEIFLSRDAAAPSALPLPDRAARRLCERLVALGAVRELTGRETFRLYGV